MEEAGKALAEVGGEIDEAPTALYARGIALCAQRRWEDGLGPLQAARAVQILFDLLSIARKVARVERRERRHGRRQRPAAVVGECRGHALVAPRQ